MVFSEPSNLIFLFERFSDDKYRWNITTNLKHVLYSVLIQSGYNKCVNSTEKIDDIRSFSRLTSSSVMSNM